VCGECGDEYKQTGAITRSSAPKSGLEMLLQQQQQHHGAPASAPPSLPPSLPPNMGGGGSAFPAPIAPLPDFDAPVPAAAPRRLIGDNRESVGGACACAATC
jgi:hypothetical protein